VHIETEKLTSTDWKRDDPAYRVHFFERSGGSRATPTSYAGYLSSEVEVRGAANIDEVAAWADSNAGPGTGVLNPGSDRTYVIYAISEGLGAAGLIRLVGVDPTAG
jgi:hypothetical protein